MHPTFIPLKQVSVPERKETYPKLQPQQTWVLRHSTMATPEQELKRSDPTLCTQGL